MQKSFWWWQCSDGYIISISPHLHTPFSPFSPSLISLMVSVGVKRHVYLLTYSTLRTVFGTWVTVRFLLISKQNVKIRNFLRFTWRLLHALLTRRANGTSICVKRCHHQTSSALDAFHHKVNVSIIDNDNPEWVWPAPVIGAVGYWLSKWRALFRRLHTSPLSYWSSAVLANVITNVRTAFMRVVCIHIGVTVCIVLQGREGNFQASLCLLWAGILFM